MENSSDYLPMLLGVNIPIHEVGFNTASHLIPKPQWFKATHEQLNRFYALFEAYLKSISIWPGVLMFFLYTR